VAGKMGVGKSSFIKSLVMETEGQEIKIDDDIKSVTDTCKLFELDKNMLSFDTSNRIYLMDTPGLESLSDSHKIVLQIEKLVLAEKL
jgi:putative ribosome biogenesis GTPase RsgA